MLTLPLLFTLITFTRVNSTNTPAYNISSLTQTSGLFYNFIGSTQISNSKLTLLTHLNVSYLIEGREALERYYTKSIGLCKLAMKDNNEHNHASFHCDQTLRIINDQLKEIYTSMETLNYLTGRIENTRRKRGLINGVSYALNWLFGTPSASDAQYYTDSINALLQDNKQTQTLLKSQIQIISSTIRNFNNSVTSLKINEDKLNENLKQINSFSQRVNNAIDKLELESLITQHILTLSALANQISSHCNEYIEAVNLGKHGILSPKVITPKILSDEILLYKGEYDLPVIPEYQNTNVLYKIITLDIFSNQGLIIFAIKIPLVDKAMYSLYQMIPLPVQHRNSSYFSFIQPRKEYLLISHTKTFSALLQSLAKCSKYSPMHFVCENVHVTSRTERQTCEIVLTNPHVKGIPEDCQTRTINAILETWHYLNNNQWLFVVPRLTTLTLVCKQHIEDVAIEGTGLIQIQRGCKGYTDGIILETSEEVKQNTSNIVPGITIIEDDCCITRKPNPQQVRLRPIKLTNVDLSELKYADAKLEELDKIITEQLDNPITVSHYRWYAVLLSVLGAALLLIICGNCCNWFGCGRLLRRLCCFTRNPQSNQLVPPLIKNFVNCTFASDIHAERRNESRDVMVYDNRREVVEMKTLSPVSEEEEELYSRPTTSATRTRYSLRTGNRRSTTPI